MFIHKYDIAKFDFIGVVRQIFQIRDLSYLHLLQTHDIPLVEHKTDQATPFHKKYYSEQQKLIPLFHSFVRNVIRHRFDEAILYQCKPTFRVQLPNNLSVGAFHKDSDYSHATEEINFFVPLTKCFDTNTIWVESTPNKKDYTPVNLEVGDLFEFRGAILTHGNVQNRTGLTRVSFDFRVLPLSKYDPNNKKVTTHMKTKMVVGDYFNIIM
jgi:hypothetical protein